MEGDLKSNLGKHVRSSEDTICGQTEHAQTGAIRMPSARKRLKMDTSIPEEDMVAALPSPSDATLPSPTEHAQMDTGIQSAAARKHWRDETGKRQAFPTTERDGSDVKQQPLSLTHRIVR